MTQTVAVLSYYDWSGACHKLTDALNRSGKYEATLYRFHNTAFNYPSMVDVTEEDYDVNVVNSGNSKIKKQVEEADVLVFNDFIDPVELLQLDLDKFEQIVFLVGSSLFIPRIKDFSSRFYGLNSQAFSRFKTAVFTVDLQQYFPHSRWLPVPINIEELHGQYEWQPKLDPPLIVHSPSIGTTRIKFMGTNEFQWLIARLQTRGKLKFQFDFVDNVLNKECLRRKAKASILFDRFYGVYGVNTIESFAFKTAVMVGQDGAIYKKIQELTGQWCPVIQTLDLDDVEKHLNFLLTNPDILDQIRERSFNYAKTIHDGTYTTQQFTQLLEEY